MGNSAIEKSEASFINNFCHSFNQKIPSTFIVDFKIQQFMIHFKSLLVVIVFPLGSFAQTKTVCSSSGVPAGWVITNVEKCTDCCGAIAGYQATRWTITKIDEMPAGSTIKICIPSSIPEGWVTINKSQCICCGTYLGPAPQLTIKKIAGLPKGSIVQVCIPSTIPADWAIIEKEQCGCCSVSDGLTAPQWTIKKL